MSAMDAHAAMSTRALGSEAVRGGMLAILLEHAKAEALRAAPEPLTRRLQPARS